jgi:hypothetical protein
VALGSRVFLLAVGLLLVASVTWCVTTRAQPDRLIFLPGGDVGLGFRSFAGDLQWIEYAPWDRNNMDYAWWSLPWWLIIVTEASLCAMLTWPIWRRKPQPKGS